MHPVHAAYYSGKEPGTKSKDKLSHYLRLKKAGKRINKWEYPRTLTLKIVAANANSEETAYGTSARPKWGKTKWGKTKCGETKCGETKWCEKCETNLTIDIDCKTPESTKEAGVDLAKYLRKKHFKNLFHETSTFGKGTHANIIVDRTGWNDRDYNDLCDRMDKWLKKELNHCQSLGLFLGVDDIEIKCRSSVVEEDGTLSNAGIPCKLPRDLDGFLTTTRIPAFDLSVLVDAETEKLDNNKPIIEKVKKTRKSTGSTPSINDSYLPTKELLKKVKKFFPKAGLKYEKGGPKNHLNITIDHAVI
jgi:hypothetical protein